MGRTSLGILLFSRMLGYVFSVSDSCPHSIDFPPALPLLIDGRIPLPPQPQEEDRDSKHYTLEGVAQRMGLGSLVSYQSRQSNHSQSRQRQPLQQSMNVVQPAQGNKAAASIGAGEGGGLLDLMPPASRLRKGLLATAVLYELISKKLERRNCKRATDVESRVGRACPSLIVMSILTYVFT